MKQTTTGGAPAAIDLDEIRRHFPALAGPTIFLENAGGSQVPRGVADAIRNYLLTSYVQLGAGYEEANRADAVVDDAHRFVNRMMNGTSTGDVILGPSSTQLITMLADCYADLLQPGDEIIVPQSGHEANVGPWVKLEKRCGVRIRTWKLDRASMTCRLEDLRALLNERTRIVAVVHVSNLLGEIADLGEITRLAHEAGARVVADGVAYAPHRAIDVAAWGVDWYVYSIYKVYGPHMAALYGRHDAIAELTGPNHFFVPRESVPYKFELGGVNHEGCAGVLALRDYLARLASMAGEANDPPGGSDDHDRRVVEQAFSVMTECELPLQRRLVEYLASRPDLTIIGPDHAEPSRVGTVSFVHSSRPAREVVAAAQVAKIGIRHGHMYAYRLCEALGIDPTDGVVRVSFVHYNRPEEIERLIEVLEG